MERLGFIYSSFPTVLVLLLVSGAGQAFQTGNSRCSQALGMASGAIPDHHITASSHYDAAVNAFYARAHKEEGGGAWCPRSMVQNEGEEYLEVNLVDDRVITKVEVQGRFGNGQGKEFAQQYKLQYYRSSIDKWVMYKDGHGSELLEGNTNTYLPKASLLSPPILASRIRFIPYSDNLRTVCMRVELYGCPYKMGLLSYTTEDGERRGSDDGLLDLTYDGSRVGGLLTGGLGQLTDGEIGHNNFRVDIKGRHNGYEWVGWKNTTRGKNPVEIIFFFDSVRNFSNVHFYVNNFFSKDVQAFSRANVLLSVDGGEHFYKGIEYQGDPERIFEEARNVSIALHDSSADTVKLQLFFTLRWLMVSEITFVSTPCRCNFSALLPPIATLAGDTMYADQTPIPVSTNSKSTPTALVAGMTALAVLTCILPVAVGVFCYRSHVAKKAMAPANDGLLARKFSVKMNDVHINMNVSRHENGNSVAKGRFYGDVALEEEVAAMYQQPYAKLNSQASTYFPTGNSSAFDVPVKSIPESEDSVDYAIPDMTMTPPPPFSEAYTIPPPIPLSKPPSLLSFTRKDGTPPPVPPLPPPPDQQYYAAPRLCRGTDISSITGTVLYMNETVYTKREKSIPTIPPGIYNVIEVIGDGDFGTIQLCKIKDNVNTTFKNITPGAVCLIKKLKPKANDVIIQSFKEEATILSKLDNPNITRLLGTTNVYEGHTMLVEYSERGDLYHFLREHTFAGSTQPTRAKPILSISDLIYIATQIASAMAYFESQRFIHRDLASRNCLVCDKLFIKITDVAMSRPIFKNHYYNPEGKVILPIRWMSWESVLEGRFSSKSDVWSFGVTLWELFTLGSCHPYDTMSDSGLLENLSHCYHGDGAGMILLQQPTSCSRDVYQIMKSCWSQQEDRRPSFHDLHSYLQRKNVGPAG
ncbi:Serine-threonine/tyrosine-protein kinase catalytic domain [Trinorchestia longiramus]|nr:Serine-threonine/tyrosine-protein kinase catalytic domain [Trinorchestia longiramus]